MHGGSHAGAYETSLMLAAAPALVDEAARARLPELAVDLPALIKAGAKNFEDAAAPTRTSATPPTPRNKRASGSTKCWWTRRWPR